MVEGEIVPLALVPQKVYPLTMLVFRTLYILKRIWDHLLFMDFSAIAGKPGYILYKMGIVDFWRKHVVPKYDPPEFSSPKILARAAQ